MSIAIDPAIKALIDQAIAAREQAYAPYSKFKVGAVVVDEQGRHFSGCNVENASYGLCNCAERTAIFSAISQGMKQIKRMVVVADTSGPVSPCGACRQVINEFANADTEIVLSNLKHDIKVMTMAELLPYDFKL